MALEAPPATPTPTTALLVLSKHDRTLAIVDPATLHVVAKVPVGDDPHEVVASSDGKVAYVSNYGGGTLHTLAVVDLVHQKALPSIDLGALRGAHGLVFEGDKVWFTAEGSKVVARFDPATASIDWVMGTGQDRTHMLYVAKDQTWIATSNVASGTVSFLDLRAVSPPSPPPATALAPVPSRAPPRGPRVDWTQTVLPVGAGAEGFDVSSDGKELWVASAQEGTVSVIDVPAHKVAQTIAADVVGANRLKLTPDGRIALVSSLRGPDVTVFERATRKVIKRVKVGRGSSGILMQPDGARAYVACSPDDNVAVVDVRTLEVVARFDAGAGPDGMA
jgi:YVTN family beta-propeller protein